MARGRTVQAWQLDALVELSMPLSDSESNTTKVLCELRGACQRLHTLIIHALIDVLLRSCTIIVEWICLLALFSRLFVI